MANHLPKAGIRQPKTIVRECNALLAGSGMVVRDWQLSHLDRPPLGNMTATVKAILIMNPELMFQYVHKVDDRSFSLDSGEIRAALGDLPLTQPDVLDWIDQYLKENLSILYGGKTT